MKRIAAVVAVLALIPASAPAQEETPKARPQDQDNKRLVAVGALSASSLYLAFVNVGLTADGFEKGVYDADTAKSIVGEVKSLIKNCSATLEDLAKGETAEGDQKALKEIVEIGGLVQEYADLLIEYTKEKDAKVGEKFQAKRKTTWERLKKFMGIK